MTLNLILQLPLPVLLSDRTGNFDNNYFRWLSAIFDRKDEVEEEEAKDVLLVRIAILTSGG